jgi:membrane protein YqaA with SNARE-associated domain
MAADSRAHWRKKAGSGIAWVSFVLGTALALSYEVLMCTAPSPDWSQMRLRTFMSAYVGAPIFILGGMVWLGSWIANRIDPDRPRD